MAEKKENSEEENQSPCTSPSLGTADISLHPGLDMQDNPLLSYSSKNDDVPTSNVVEPSHDSSTNINSDGTLTDSAEMETKEQQQDDGKDNIEPGRGDPPTTTPDGNNDEDKVEHVVDCPSETATDNESKTDITILHQGETTEIGPSSEQIVTDNNIAVEKNDKPEADVTTSHQEETTMIEKRSKQVISDPPVTMNNNDVVKENNKSTTDDTVSQQEETSETEKLFDSVADDHPVIKTDDNDASDNYKIECAFKIQQQEETNIKKTSEPVVEPTTTTMPIVAHKEKEEDNDESVTITETVKKVAKEEGEMISETKETEIIAEKEDIEEDEKAKMEQKSREDVLKEARRKSEEVTKKMTEIQAKLKAEQEDRLSAEAEDQLEERKTMATLIKNEEDQRIGMLETTEPNLMTKENEKSIPQQTNITDDVEKKSQIPTQKSIDTTGKNRNEEDDGDAFAVAVAVKSDRNLVGEDEAPLQLKQDVGENRDESALVKEQITSSGEKKDEAIASIEPISTPLEQAENGDNGEQDMTVNLYSQETTPKGLSFAQAFSSKKLTPKPNPSPLLTPTSSEVLSNQGTTPIPDPLSTPNSAASHSALSAAKNKKASGLIFKYEEKTAHSPLPGDSIPIRSAKGPAFSPSISPGSERIIKKKLAATTVELAHLPSLNSVRQKFEKSARKSGGNFEFGESFRLKKRHEQLSEKERIEEAKISIRGFNEKLMNEGRALSGEIDTSNLPKSFTFEISSHGSITPNDGVCRVDYKSVDFQAMVFVVHRTRGMLLLQGRTSSNANTEVPGGAILEKEFLDAADQSGSPQVQLQIAAREAAARQLFETTGLDIRQQANRFKPAVLAMNPSMNAARGFQYLRNENDNKLYYFLQVDEDDLKVLQDDTVNTTSEKPSADPGDEQVPLLKLSKNYSGFEFVHDPVDATDVLKKDGNDAATALNMIMRAAAMEIKENIQTSHGTKDPDAKATVFSSKNSVPDDAPNGTLINDNVRTVGMKKSEEQRQQQQQQQVEKKNEGKKTGKSMIDHENENIFAHDEATLNLKTPSVDPSQDAIAVSCCCSFW